MRAGLPGGQADHIDFGAALVIKPQAPAKSSRFVIRMRGNAKYAWHPKIVSEVRVGDRRLVCPAERSSASGNVANRRGRNKRKTDRNYDWFANLKVACLDAAGLALAQTRASPPHQ